MRRISVWFFSTVAAVVWLFSYSTSTARSLQATPAAPGDSRSAKPGKAAVGTSDPNAPVPVPNPANGPVTEVAGAAVDTRWGTVEVHLQLQKGKIAAVTLLKKPGGNAFSDFINARAIPVLINETVDSQGQAVDTVTGATITSTGYLASLQSALDAAHA